MNEKSWAFLLIRYFIIVFLGLGNLAIIYSILSPITVTSAFFFINLFGSARLSGSFITFSGIAIEISRPCVAGSAFYLLLILNLSTPMPFKLAIKSILFSIATLFVLNQIRIILFAFLFSSSFQFANILHSLTWYALSIFFVIGIWFYSVSSFNIKSIPIYTDLRTILSAIRSLK